MKFCIFDVIIDNALFFLGFQPVLWIDEILYLWCDYRQQLFAPENYSMCCELMKFCIFDVIIDNDERIDEKTRYVVNWWNFVSLMWL